MLRSSRRHLVLAAITGVALAIRLRHNLVVHPPEDFLWSDMGGYAERAKGVFSAPFTKDPWSVFFPFGTHVFVAAVRRVFGEEKGTLGVAFAALGAWVVPFTYGVAREASFVLRPRISPARVSRLPAYAAAALAAVYYPLVGLGGYVLSEIPFAACLLPATYFALRTGRTGSPRSAWLFGAFTALAATCRPQILLWLPLAAAAQVVSRLRGDRSFRLGARLWARALVPVALVIALSAVRVRYHADRWGVVSTNGELNYVFGRCHNQGLWTRWKGERAMFGPPPFYGLARHEKKHPESFFGLDPALEREIKVEGRMWQKDVMAELARRCIEKTGLAGQARYAATHVAMLYALNETWPDGAVKKTKKRLRRWTKHAPTVLAPASALALLASLRRRLSRLALASSHLVALAATAALFFGDQRLRTPYDPIVFALGFPIALAALGRLALGLRRRLRLP